MDYKELLQAKDHQAAKGPIFFGKNKLLVYERDNRTTNFPGYLDFPGGGKENGETVFQTFSREAKEEFNLDISVADIISVKRYPSTKFVGELAYFVVASLPESDLEKIRFGSEGVNYKIIDSKEYLSSPKAVPFLRERLLEFLSK